MGVCNNMKKLLISMICAIMLLMSMSVTAFAEEAKGSGGNLGDFSVNISGDGLKITGGGDFEQGSATAWNNFFKKYKKFIVGISGIGAITMVGCFIFCFMKLGASSTNPQARQQALTGVLWSGIAAAGLGAVTIIVGFFYSAFK